MRQESDGRDVGEQIGVQPRRFLSPRNSAIGRSTHLATRATRQTELPIMESNSIKTPARIDPLEKHRLPCLSAVGGTKNDIGTVIPGIGVVLDSYSPPMVP